jgi:hypothetical protein
MRVYHVIVGAVVLGTALPVALHHAQHGLVNPHQVGLAFFFWLNVIIAFWEISLLLRRDEVAEHFAEIKEAYLGRELERSKEFFGSKIALSRVLSPSSWVQLWTSYALFDRSYADRSSYGFMIDVGNGFMTMAPSLLCAYAMTYQLLPARLFGIVLCMLCYQMWYGTVVYFASFVLNKRYRGHTIGNLILFVGMSNGIWFSFPLWGMWVGYRLIESASYAVFLGG